MEEDKVDQEGKCKVIGKGRNFCIEFNIPEIEHPMPNVDFFELLNRSFERGFGRGFGREFGFKIQPKEYTPEEKVELLKKQKKFFEEKALKIGEHLKELEKPLKKEKKKPLEKVKKPLEKEKKKGAKK